ncbi:BTAD domain-containing putative transcriptional regulator [Streptomyces adustus]|uniref:AfsR/SARP family transcriptional regulator n=1 Tax=Streptomyces adustus TaxID=1609272 RepID=UPI0035DD8440
MVDAFVHDIGSRMHAGLRYQLLGPVAVHCGGEVVRLGGRRQRTVLAALLLSANRVVSEDQLVDVLWESSPPSSARGQLQVRISELRKLLGRAVIVRRAPGYLIEVGDGELDLDVFESTVIQARAMVARGDARLGIKHFREALELWQGPPLGGVTDRLISRAGQVVEERRTAVLEELFAAEFAVGRHAEVIGELMETCEAHPFREHLQAQLMRALQHAGRSSEALAVYAKVRRWLSSELGIEPGTELRQVHMDILNGQEAPLGKDGDADAVDERARPGTVEVARPAELPFDARGFAGRARALEQLDSHLADIERRGDAGADIWVIHGAAGVGKTAMVVHWAWRVRHRFPDGQLYVNLRGFDGESRPVSPGVALAHLLRSLGTDPQRIPADLDQRIGLYRSLLADRRILLLLDNVHDVEQVLPLLPPAGTVLVTSRQRLSELIARTGARSLPLDVLVPGDSRDLLSGVLGPDRIAAETRAADDLARLCGHLPLALRVAAANVNARPEPRIADLVAELGQGGRLAGLTLDGADEGVVTRAFDASYEALSPPLQRIFRLLALVPGADFTAEVAAALADVPVGEATRRLTALAAVHLLEQHTRDRFRFHDLIHEYALEKMRVEETATSCGASWDRLVESYLATADVANDRFGRVLLHLPRDQEISRGPLVEIPDGRAAMAWLDAERSNLFAVLGEAAARGPFPVAWYLADAARNLAHHGGMWSEWLETAGILVDAARERDAPRVEALMLQSIGTTCIYLGHWDSAIDHLRLAITVYRACGWLEGEVTAINAFGAALQKSARYVEAIEQYKIGVERQRPLDSRMGELMLLSNLGFTYRQVGLPDEAEQALTRASFLAEEEASRWGKAQALLNLGYALQLRGDTARALDTLTQAAALHRELGSRYGVAYTLGRLSDVRSDMGDYRQARDDARVALGEARLDRNGETELVALNALSRAEAALGLFDSAIEHQEEAVMAARHPGSTGWDLAEAVTGLCAVRGSSGDVEGAITAGLEALRLARESGLLPFEARSLLGLAAAHAAYGANQEAAELLHASLMLCEEYGFGALEAQARDLLAELTGRTAT